jgi:hypothetical protein
MSTAGQNEINIMRLSKSLHFMMTEKCREFAEDFFKRSPKYRGRKRLERDMQNLVKLAVQNERMEIAKKYSEARGVDHDSFIDYLVN